MIAGDFLSRLQRRWWAWRLRRLERRIDLAHFDRELSRRIDALRAKLEAGR